MSAATSVSVDASPIVAVSAADEAYAVALAVTIRSTLDTLAWDRCLRLFVVDGGLANATRARLLASWDDPRLSVEWLECDFTSLSHAPVSGHVSATTYGRLLLADLLPVEIDKAIYLDADMLVLRDLGVLWDEPIAGADALAVRDQGAPVFDASAALPNYHRCRHFLASDRPVSNYRELGLRGDAPYFNGGLFVADLASWRRNGYTQRLLAVLHDHREHVRWWDQYALNVVLSGRWRELDSRWNQSAHLFAYPTWRDSPFERREFELLRDDPWIVHFSSLMKPWHTLCPHPFAKQFRRCQSTTAWCGTPLTIPKRFLRTLWKQHYKPAKRLVRARLSALRDAWTRSAA